MSRQMTLGDGSLDALLSSPLKDVSTAELSKLFAGGAKSPDKWMVGLELEVLPFHRKDLRPVDHASISKILERLADTGFSRETEKDGKLTGLSNQGQIVSLEPGGQFEFASRPHRSLRKLRDEVCAFVETLNDCSDKEDVGFWAIGHHPFETRDTIPKTPRPRYAVMRQYMAKRGNRALDMMHLTGSIQSTVDYEDERNMTAKVRTAAKVSPFLTALCASSPFTAGKPNGLRSMRYQIWLDTDDTRSGIWRSMLDDEGLTFTRYIEHCLATPAMFFIRDGDFRLAEATPFSQYAVSGFEGSTVTVSDFVDHLTSMFPEVRVKNYVELRGADCAPPAQAVAVAGFWRGILDDEDTRLAAEERLSGIGYDEIIALQPQVAEHGLDATSPAGPVKEVAKWIVDTAYNRLAGSAPDCAECILPLVERAERGRSLADDMLEKAASTSVEDALKLVTV